MGSLVARTQIQIVLRCLESISIIKITIRSDFQNFENKKQGFELLSPFHLYYYSWGIFHQHQIILIPIYGGCFSTDSHMLYIFLRVCPIIFLYLFYYIIFLYTIYILYTYFTPVNRNRGTIVGGRASPSIVIRSFLCRWKNIP